MELKKQVGANTHTRMKSNALNLALQRLRNDSDNLVIVHDPELGTININTRSGVTSIDDPITYSAPRLVNPKIGTVVCKHTQRLYPTKACQVTFVVLGNLWQDDTSCSLLLFIRHAYENAVSGRSW